MDRNALVNLSVELGRRMMASGAEIHRVEDSVRRLLHAYGVEDAEVFAIPNCLMVGVNAPDQPPITQLSRIPHHGTDLDMLEQCNAVCRRLCAERPPLDAAARQINEIDALRPRYSERMTLLGHFLVAAFFTPFFGGSGTDMLCGGLCGLSVGLSSLLFDRIPGTHDFFRTLFSAAASALLALLLAHAGLAADPDAITVGALMLLVPGVALTNAMREVMAGDIVSGVTRTAESLLTGTAIALGVGLAMILGQPL